MKIFINNTRTFGDYENYRHHHDLMLANQCMATACGDVDKVDVPKKGDIVALYADKIGIVAFGTVTDGFDRLSDSRVGGEDTRIRKLKDFCFVTIPIKAGEFKSGVRGTLHEVKMDKTGFHKLLLSRAIGQTDKRLFKLK